MASDLNLCQFIGRLARDPEIKYTQGGVAVANFTVACGEKYKTKAGEQVENTEWVKCTAWRRLAEVIGEYLSKGSQVYISGKQQTRKWEDKDGNNRYSTEIQVDRMQMLGSKGERQERGPEGTNPGDKTLDGSNEEIPF
jgi:single-strand DNA-binding protein